MSVLDPLRWFRDTALRLLPHATRPGLRRIGSPTPDSPVVVTGNFTLTVRRLARALRGRDAWLLVVNSHGINVWCAATGGHLTHHDVIAAVRAFRVADAVSHRTLVLPQLAATGVERRPIEDATGFSVHWGPASAEDLPRYLDRGGKVHRPERTVRFPWRDRVEMALMWGLPMAPVAGLISAWAVDARLGLAVAIAVMATVAGLFLVLPRVPVTGPRRGWTFGGVALVTALVGLGVRALLGAITPAVIVAVVLVGLATMLLLSIDLAGSTPHLASTVNTRTERLFIDLVEARCTGVGDCVQVCPTDVLILDGHRRRAVLARPTQCVQCGACVVQCPEDALRFLRGDGTWVEPATIRQTRMNLIGRRTVEVRPPRARACGEWPTAGGDSTTPPPEPDPRGT